MSSMDLNVLRSYELEANAALNDPQCQLTRGDKIGEGLVVQVRDELAAVRQKLVQQLLTVSLHLSTFKELDAKHKVTALRPTEQYPALDIETITAILTGVDRKEESEGQLTNDLVGVVSEFMTNREFAERGPELVEALAEDPNIEAVRTARNLTNDTVLHAVEGILAGKAPEIDIKLKERLKQVQKVPGLQELFREADPLKLDLIITFLIDHCPSLRSLEFIEAPGLSLGIMYKLGRFEHLETLCIKEKFWASSPLFNEAMFGALATSLKSLKKLSIKNCRGFTLAAFAQKDRNGVTYAAHMKQLTCFKYVPAMNSPITADTIRVITHEMAELTELSIDQGGAVNYVGGINDAGVTHIARNLKKLTHLCLYGCYNGLTEAAFTTADAQGVTNAEHLKGLLELDLSSSDQIGDRALHAIATHMTKLTRLACPVLTIISNHSITAMTRNLGQLTALGLRNCYMSNRDLTTLLEKLNKITHLDLEVFQGDPSVSGAMNESVNSAVAALTPYLPRLTHLSMSFCGELTNTAFITKDRNGLTAIERMKDLESLELRNTRIGDATALAILKHMKRLTDLDMRDCSGLSVAVKQQLKLHFPFTMLEQSDKKPESE